MRSRPVYVGLERCRSSSFASQITFGQTTTEAYIRLCYEWDNIKPDMVILGKALSGGGEYLQTVVRSGANGSLPRIMCHGEQGDHAHHQARRARINIRRVRPSPSSNNRELTSRNPLGCAVAITALEVLEREDLANRSQRLGEIFRQGLRELNSPFIKIIRGRGLFNGVVIDESVSTKKRTAWQLCLLMKSKG